VSIPVIFIFAIFWFADSGLIAFLVCLELLSVENQPLHDLVDDINPYYRSGEQNSRVISIADSIAAVRDAFAKGEMDELDGLTVQYPDFWFNLRPSNTEPLLRLNVEASTPQLLSEKTSELLGIIRGGTS